MTVDIADIDDFTALEGGITVTSESISYTVTQGQNLAYTVSLAIGEASAPRYSLNFLTFYCCLHLSVFETNLDLAG